MNRSFTRRVLACTGLAALTACGGDRSELQPGELVTLASAGASNPTIVMEPGGRATYASWIGLTDAHANVYVARSADGATFSAPVRVNDIDGDAAPHEQAPAQVAVAPDGTVYVVWQNNRIVPGRRFPASNLRLARSTDGGQTFEPAIYVNDDADDMPSSHTFHDIAVGADGAVYVSWIDGRERTRAELARTPAHHSAPPSGTHASGMSHGMHDTTLPGSQIRLAKSHDGGRTFGPSVVVHPDACPCCRTSLALGTKNVVFIGFRSAARNVRDPVIARSNDGGATFEPAVRVHADEWTLDACPHAGPSLALDAEGTLHVAWYTGVTERQGIWYATSSDAGTTFTAPVPLESSAWYPVSQVKLAVDRAGAVWAVWDDKRPEQPVVRLAEVRAGSVKSVQLPAAGRSPDIAVSADVVVAWHADTMAHALRYHRARRAGH